MESNTPLKDDLLRAGLSHRNNTIKLSCIQRLNNKNKLTIDDAITIENDDSATIRKEILEIPIEHYKSLSDKEIKNILVKPKASLGLGLISNTDTEGEKYYKEYRIKTLRRLSEEKLNNLSENETAYDKLAYFVLCDKYFNKYADDLRQNIDDYFDSFFESHIKKAEELFGTSPNDLIIKMRNLEDFVRRGLTRQALDILCEKSKKEDLPRIRKCLNDDFVDSSFQEIDYLKTWGDWSDIPSIINCKKETSDPTYSLFNIDNAKKWNRAIAETIYKLGINKTEELFKLDIPGHILEHLLVITPKSKFSKLSTSTILSLLNNKSSYVRKHCSLKCISSLPKSKVKILLDNYVDKDEYRYYNVIHWLDFGVTMKKSISNQSIKLIYEQID
jgi:hypothetical protein